MRPCATAVQICDQSVTPNPTLPSRLSPDRNAPFQYSCTPGEAGAERSKQDSSAIARRADAKQVS